jgi:condensin-2 complex subunit D3
MEIVRFLLQFVTDEQKFAITAKLCQDVLGAVAEGVMAAEKECADVLRDALIILASKVERARARWAQMIGAGRH